MNDGYLSEFEEQSGYLNYASVGPASKSARTASARLLDAMAVGDRPIPNIIEPAYSDARATIAAALGVEDRFATSVPSTGAGIMQVAFGLIGAGGTSWCRPTSSRRIATHGFAAAIDSETQLVAVSLVDYMTGFRCGAGERRLHRLGAERVDSGFAACHNTVGCHRSVRGRAS